MDILEDPNKNYKKVYVNFVESEAVVERTLVANAAGRWVNFMVYLADFMVNCMVIPIESIKIAVVILVLLEHVVQITDRAQNVGGKLLVTKTQEPR